MSASESSRRLAAIADAGRRLAAGTTTGRLVLARLARAVELDSLAPRDRERVARVLGDQSRPVLDPLGPDELEATLREAWQADPREVLDRLELEPIAVTPTAQVHRAEHDGAEVAVKVLRPGLAERFRQDFVLLESLALPLAAAFPALDVRALLREARERVLDEFDLEHEAAAQRRFSRRLRRHPFLSVPAPVTELARENVMVSAWASGTPLFQTGDPDTAAARLVIFVLGGAREGLLHADPDPDDLLLAEDGTLIVLDFGAVASVAPDRAAAMLGVVDAFGAGDAGAFGRALEELGALDASRGEQALELARSALGELGEASPSRLDARAAAGAARRLSARREDVLELVLSGRLPPQDLWPARAVLQLAALLSRLGATAPWRELVGRALRDGWSAAPEEG